MDGKPSERDQGGTVSTGLGGSSAPVLWGPYEPAIRRWERVIGRDAPNPVDDRGRLSPLLVEWMQGYERGWVTDLLKRTDALRCLGNSVVPQQAAHALRLLGLEPLAH